MAEKTLSDKPTADVGNHPKKLHGNPESPDQSAATPAVDGPATEQTIRSPYLVKRLFDTKEKNLFNDVKFHLIRDCLQDLAPPLPRVLDVGCGLQIANRYLDSLGLEHDYYGVDYEQNFNPDAVVDLMTLDNGALNPPWEPDAMLLLDVLEHLHEDVDVLDGVVEKIAKKCARSTLVLISVPQMYRLDRFKLPHLNYPEHKIRLTQKEWCQLLGNHFEIKSVQGYGFLSVIPYLPMASRRYRDDNRLGKLFTFLRGKFFEWPPFKPIDLILSKTIGEIPWIKTWSNETLIVARPYNR